MSTASQEHVMSISHQQETQLRGIEAGLCRSDPRLAATMAEFGRLDPGQNMPTAGSVGGAPQDHLTSRAIAWMVVVLTVLAALMVLTMLMLG
jgi:hypothetical protein